MSSILARRGPLWLPACFHGAAVSRNRARHRKYNVLMRTRLVQFHARDSRPRRGFSLVELLIVILIILILAALVAWAFVKIRAVVRALDPKATAPTPTTTAPARST